MTAIQDLTVNEKLHAVEANLEKIYDLLRDTISIAEDAYNEESDSVKRYDIYGILLNMEDVKTHIDESVNQFKNI
jgi:hypothetical protein